MTSKKTGFSLEQHDRIGLELQTIYDRIRVISTEISKNYNLSGNDGKAYKLSKQVVEKVRNLRYELQRHAGNENRHLDHTDIQRLCEKKFCDIYIRNPAPIRPFPQE